MHPEVRSLFLIYIGEPLISAHQGVKHIQYLLTQISIFPSKEFYAGSLEDGDLLRNSTRRLWHKHRCFGPFCFFDIDGAESQPSGTGSWVNEDEIEFIVLLYHKLASQYLTLKSSSQLAIISPYRYQVKLLHEKFRTTFGEKYNQSVDINTVDGFQVKTFRAFRFSK
ncbi:putative helicase MAGATAMA 3 [Dendrobium catenatum]|uniref:Putative helicase MAGATAMA 3 n=1 Tax=Dendrobium catenatum TaxID=906689 RepID=A0A2I0VZY6_9ASPA|nr:putative helicase MAGATAMA 3 [Dendrobium catenatum]